MKTNSFIAILKEMNNSQRTTLEELESMHSDLVWHGGKIDTRPLRVSIKSISDQSMAAINTRERKAFFRLEFRSRDYDGPKASPTGHIGFDRKYDIVESDDTLDASGIISAIKQNYEE
jgi:hypothetical protein